MATDYVIVDVVDKIPICISLPEYPGIRCIACFADANSAARYLEENCDKPEEYQAIVAPANFKTEFANRFDFKPESVKYVLVEFTD